MESILPIMLPAFCECLVLVGIHSYLGLHVIRRKVIFVDLAFAQIAALGTLIAFLFGIPPHSGGSFVFALLLTVAGAAVFSLCRFRESRIPEEAIIGLVYALAAATSILLIDKAPHGAEHLKEIMTGSILWVRWESILVAAVVYAGVGLFHYVFRKKFILISEHPEKAWESGVNVRFWDFLFYLSFGVVITVSVDVAGVLIVFVFLVAPAILAMTLTDRLGRQLLLGWGLGLVVTTFGLLLACLADLPTGPAVIATYGITLVVVAGATYVLRSEKRSIGLRNAGLVAGVCLLGAIGLWLLGNALGARYVAEAAAGHTALGPAKAETGAEPVLEAEDVLEALRADHKSGVAMALRYLRTDPPPFYREEVIEVLVASMESPPAFNVEEGMDSAVNREALKAVAEFFGVD
jgi:zinc/manganese transport system permease protein